MDNERQITRFISAKSVTATFGRSGDLVYFRKRIGKEGVKKILKVSIDLHGRKAREREVLVDTTVQEKNIAFPTDTKLYKRVIEHCVDIAVKERIALGQSYKRATKKLVRQLFDYLRFDFLALNFQLNESIPIAIVT